MSYEKQNFVDNQILTADNLNHIEDGIENLEQNKVDKKYVDEAIENVQLDMSEDYVKKESLSTVATSGDYNDLTNKPELPFNVVYMSAREYTRKIINNEELNSDVTYINEQGNANEFVFDAVKDEYENKALIKSNNEYAAVDITIEEYLIDSSVQEIYFNLNNSNVCKKIVAQDTCIVDKIEVHNSVNVQRIHLLNQVNEEMMVRLAKSLIDRNGIAWGSIIIKDQELRKKVENEFIKKDWYFGSPKIYDSVESAKIQQYMYDSGIVDIWESAEYGEGARLGIADSGLRLDMAELDTTNFLGAVDLFLNNGETRLESISVGTSTVSNVIHGSAIYSLVAGKGVRYYGVAPKCSWYFIKIAGEDGYSSIEAMAQVPIVAIQNKLEFCTMSYSSSILSQQTMSFHDGDKLYYDILREYVEEYNGVFNTCVRNNYNYLQAYTLYASWKPACMTHAAYLSGGVYKRIDASTAYNTPFTAYSYLPVNVYGNTYKNFNGSSCATPIMTGIYMLVSNIFKKKHGRRPSKYELVELLKNRTVQCRNNSGTITEDPTLVGYGLINVMAFRDVSHINIQYVEREDA